MRFKTDENIHTDVAVFLRRHGHDVFTVWDESLQGVTDINLAQTCLNESRALITLDLDFADIRRYSPEQFSGLIVLRLASQSRVHVLQSMTRLLPWLATNKVSGHLWIVTEHNIRVRGVDK